MSANIYHPEVAEPRNYVLMNGGNSMSIIGPDFADHILEETPHADLTYIVPVTDNGSATGDDRRVFGGPAVGDARRVLAAMSPLPAGKLFGSKFAACATPEDVDDMGIELLDMMQFGGSAKYTSAEMRRAAEADFRLLGGMATRLVYETESGIEGHSIGNLVTIAMMKNREIELGDALAEVSRMLALNPQIHVMPVSNQPATLMAMDGGRIYKGEDTIDKLTFADPENALVWVVPDSKRHPRVSVYGPAYHSIRRADRVILGPTSLHTSLGAMLATPGVRGALDANRKQGGQMAWVANATEDRDSKDMVVDSVAAKVSRMAGRMVDVVFVNNDFGPLDDSQQPLRHQPRDDPRVPAPVVERGFLRIEPPAGREVNDRLSGRRSKATTDGGEVARAVVEFRPIPQPHGTFVAGRPGIV